MIFEEAPIAVRLIISKDVGWRRKLGRRLEFTGRDEAHPTSQSCHGSDRESSAVEKVVRGGGHPLLEGCMDGVETLTLAGVYWAG
jgi:hypothetical protein